jgi:hypothetical protein
VLPCSEPCQQLRQRDQGLTTAYQKADKRLQETAQPALKATQASPELTSAQKGQLLVLQKGVRTMRAMVSQGWFNTAQHKEAMAAKEKARGAFEQIRKESGMSNEFVDLMTKTVLSELND